MIIETNRLILRPFKMEDVDEFFKIIDKSIKKYLWSYSKIECTEDLNELVSAYSKGDFKNDFYYAICDKVTNSIVGTIIAVKTSSCILDVSYFIGDTYRNNGYMREALLGFKRFLSNSNFLYSNLQLTTEKSNKVSQRVIEYCGGKCHRDCRDFIIWRIEVKH